LVKGRACCAAFRDGSRSDFRLGQETHGGVAFLSLRLSIYQIVVLWCWSRDEEFDGWRNESEEGREKGGASEETYKSIHREGHLTMTSWASLEAGRSEVVLSILGFLGLQNFPRSHSHTHSPQPAYDRKGDVSQFGTQNFVFFLIVPWAQIVKSGDAAMSSCQ
jgi:hypothetical protein